jgi:hypothetical protein
MLDGNSLIETFGRESLRRALVQPRRPLINGKHLLRLLHSREDGISILRWDCLFLTPASPYGEKIFAEVLHFLSLESTIAVHLKNLGDTLIIDNWRMLHGRSLIPQNASLRHIDRAYLAEVL